MKVFKAAIVIALSLIIPAALNFSPALAEVAPDGRQYARADARNVYFCSDMDISTALFAVPYTYCVEIIADHGEWYLVRYAKDEGIYRSVTGYCQKTGLTFVSAPPEQLYLNYPVTTVLRSDVPADGSLPGLEIQVTAAYYGVYYRGASAFSYVYYDGSFKYIAGANEDYPLNEIPAEPTFGESGGEQTESNDSKLVTAVIICVLAAATIVVLVFTGKARKSRPGGYKRQ